MEVESGPVVVEVRNLLYAVTEAQFRSRVLERACRLSRESVLSCSLPPRTGRATLELVSQAVAELAIAALKGPRDGSQLDYTMDVRDCVQFKAALDEIHCIRDEESRDWLETHAFRAEKQLLGKMAHRKSNRRMFWENSLYKFDHSARDAEGQRVQKREMMAKDSSVRAPIPTSTTPRPCWP